MVRSLAVVALALAMLAPGHFDAPPDAVRTGARLVVSPTGPYTSIAAAVSAADAGDTIEVHGGSYSGGLVVDKSVALIGQDWPVIDGGNRGTVVLLTAPDITLTGFVIRNSGSSLNEENSGIAGEAPGLRIEGNRLEETLFGIYLRDAARSVIRNNRIESKALDVPRRGDPIRVWYSNHVRIEDNRVLRGRDVVLWYSEDLTVTNNVIAEGRYGLHFMYCDDAYISGNILSDNSVGTFMMYSRRLYLHRNTISGNRGPSGYGIGLKDMDDAVVSENLFVDNRIGAYIDNSPREIDSAGRFEGNTFAYNDMGVSILPSVRNNSFGSNSFIDNGEHVHIAGGGVLRDNDWVIDEIGNYWSDYAGYDQQGDGIGDASYRSVRLFDQLRDRHPNLQFFVYSPAAQGVDYAARAAPIVQPQAKLVDDAPLMSPRIPAGLATPQRASSRGSMLAVSALLLISVAFGVAKAARGTRLRRTSPIGHTP